MWFMFGFLTLTICIFASYSARASARWTPDKREEKYEFKLKKHKGNVTGLLFGVTATQSFEFSVKPEVWYDRFFKKLKVSNEIQTGDVEFDTAFYILADNPLIEKALVSSDVIRNSIKTIFKFGLNDRIRIRRLECRDNRLWIECSCVNQVDESNIGERIAKHILVELSAILKELNNQDVADYHRWKDPFVYKSLVVLGLSTGLAVNAGFQLFRTWLGDFPFIVNTNTLLVHSILGGFLIVIGLTTFTLYWLKNSSRTHIVLIELLTVGLLGAVGTAFHELRDANIEWRQTKPEVLITELQDHYVVKKRKWRFRRRGSIETTHYYFLLKDWNCQCDKTYEKEVSQDLYRRLNYYQYLGIVQHPGALGYKWVSDIKPSNYSQTR